MIEIYVVNKLERQKILQTLEDRRVEYQHQHHPFVELQLLHRSHSHTINVFQWIEKTFLHRYQQSIPSWYNCECYSTRNLMSV